MKQFLVLSLAFFGLLSSPAFAMSNQTVNGVTWYYYVDNNASILGNGAGSPASSQQAVARSTSGSLTIPSRLGGHPVTTIATYGFYLCSKITSLTIPEGVTSIGQYAFQGCSSLKSITIPESMQTIKSLAFYTCSKLETIVIPDGITEIGSSIFRECSGLKKLYVPKRYQGHTGTWEIPSSCTVVYYDSQLTLTTISEHGQTSPATGATIQRGSARITASVLDPEPEGGVRYVCTGWKGTGSVPSSGSAKTCSFQILANSTLTWNWETQVWVSCSIAGDASATTATSWQPEGTGVVVVPFEPSTEHFAWTLSGDTNGVVVDATAQTVSIPVNEPHTVTLIIHAFSIIEGGGVPLSWNGIGGEGGWNVLPDSNADDGFVLCSSGVEAGAASAVEAVVQGPGKLSFDWKIEANRGDRLYVLVDGDQKAERSVRASGWATESVLIEGEDEHVVRWVYERKSSTTTGENAAFLDNVAWRPIVSLSVSSVAGKPVPKRGSNTFYYGDEIAASVAHAVPPRGTRHTCLGWTGTGSVPESGTGTNVTFEITEDSSIAWNWLTEHRIEFRPSGAVASDFGGVWAREGETVVAPWRLLAGYDSLSLGGDADGVVLDEATRTLSIPADRPRTVTLRTNKAISLADALDAPGISWSTDDGPAAWLGQGTETSDGEDAATSGVATGGAGSVLTAMVEGPGTLSWKWKLVADGVSGVDVIVDDTAEAEFWIEDPCDWTDASVEIDGDGPHAVRFLFWNSGDATGDHAAMDQVSWSGAATKETTQATAAEVPFAWLSGYGLGTDGNWDGAAFAPAANGIDDVWQCYVSGIDPTDPAARFIAAIEMVEGEPDIRPLPDLGTNRVYVVQGKDALEEYDWGPTNAASRFFRIKVAIPK